MMGKGENTSNILGFSQCSHFLFLSRFNPILCMLNDSDTGEDTDSGTLGYFRVDRP